MNFLSSLLKNPIIKASLVLAGIALCETLAFGLYKGLKETGCNLDI